MAFVRFSFLSCTSPAGLRGLRVEQVYKTPKAGSVTPHALRKWSLSSCVTSSHGSDSSPGSRRVGIHSEGAEQQIEVRGRGGTRPGGHTLAGQPPGLQISASQFGLPVLPGRESASGGSPFPGPSPTDCSLPAAPQQEAIPNPGPGTGVEKVKGGKAGNGNRLQPSWPSGCVPGRRRGPLPGSLRIIFTSALGHRPSHPCSTDMDLETQGGLETCSKPALKRRSGP